MQPRITLHSNLSFKESHITIRPAYKGQSELVVLFDDNTLTVPITKDDCEKVLPAALAIGGTEAFAKAIASLLALKGGLKVVRKLLDAGQAAADKHELESLAEAKAR